MLDDLQPPPNIYAQWYNALKAKGAGASLRPIKGLQSLSLTEIRHLRSLLNEELKNRREDDYTV